MSHYSPTCLLRLLFAGSLFTVLMLFLFCDDSIMSFRKPPLEVDPLKKRIKTGSITALKPAKTSANEVSYRFFSRKDNPQEWKKTLLDQGTVTLTVLKTPLQLSDSTIPGGSEAFFYASFLFDQIANNIQNRQLKQEINQLSLEVQTVGRQIYQLSEIYYSGPPQEDLQHLLVQNHLAKEIWQLNSNNALALEYSQRGHILNTRSMSISPPQTIHTTVASILHQLNNIQSHPASKHYPETMAFLARECKLLQQFMSHITLYIEKWQPCQTTCPTASISYIKIYTHQSMPASTPLFVTL